MRQRRENLRQAAETAVNVSSITSIDHFITIAQNGWIEEASISGFKIIIKRDDIVPQVLRDSLSLHSIEGDHVMLHLPQLNIEISGRIVRTKQLGKKGYELIVDYSEDSPEYWRECLLDLLPTPEELDEDFE